MKKRPLVFMALIVLSGITCGLHDINRMVKIASAVFMLYIVLQKMGDLKHRSFFFCIKIYSLYIILFLSGYVRADMEYKRFNTQDAVEFFKEKSPANPGEFDYALYLKSKGIYSQKMLDECKEKIMPLNNIRKYTLDKLSRGFNNEDAGVLRAMLIGDKSEMNTDLKMLYQDAGISHMISISGLHVSFAGMSFFTILKNMNAGIGFSLLGASLFTMFYGFITGGAVSTVRAVIMIIIRYLGIYLGKGYDMITAVFVSAVAIIFFRPYMLLQSGFQLSFSAVLAISCISGTVIEAFRIYFDRKPGKFISALIVCIAVQIMAFPILAYHFYEVNLSSIILNLIVVPLAGFVIYSGAAVIFGGLISDIFKFFTASEINLYTILGAPAHYILKLFKNLALLGDNLPLSSVRTGRPGNLQITFYYLLLSFVLISLKKYCHNKNKKNKVTKNNILICVLLLILLFTFSPLILKQTYSDKLKIVNLDVGQGDSCLILDRRKAVIIDGGSSTRRDIYEAVIDKTLGFYGINKLDAVFISHADADHVNGIEDMIGDKDIKIGMLIFPKPAANHEKYKRIEEKFYSFENKKPKYIKTGDEIHISERLSIKCIQEGIEDGQDVNRHSSFLMINYGEFNMLSTGDAVAKDEIRASFRLKNELGVERISFFKAGHHGSGGSNTKEFIDIIKPEYVFFSCARKNRYGHPDPAVVEYCLKKKARCLFSYSSGAVIIECDKDGFDVRHWRD